jgi:hypothetical protein
MDEDEDSDVMDECAAAMVLMRLSCSPHSPRWEGEFYQIKMGVPFIHVELCNNDRLTQQMLQHGSRVITVAVAAVGLFRGAEVCLAAVIHHHTLRRRVQQERPAGFFRSALGAS